MIINLKFIQEVNRLLEQYPGSTERLTSTPTHNASVGGAPESAHLCEQGATAIDLVFDDRPTLMAAARFAYGQCSFNGIELDLRNNHLHLDNKPRVWQVVYLSDGTQRPFKEWVQKIPSEV